MKSIEYFYREHHHNFFCSVTNKKAIEYVYDESGYNRMYFDSNPYVLRVTTLNEIFPGQHPPQYKKINFIAPIVKRECGSYLEIPFNEYKKRIAEGLPVEYVIIGEYDRLKFNTWHKNGRNFRYDIISFSDLDNVSKRIPNPISRGGAKVLHRY